VARERHDATIHSHLAISTPVGRTELQPPVGKVAPGVAPLVACRHGADKGRGTRKKDLAIEASRGAKIHGQRREALVQRMAVSAFPRSQKSISAWIYSVNAAMALRMRTIFQTISLCDELRLRASRSTEIALSIEGNQPLSANRLRRILSIALWTSSVAS